MKTPDEYRQDAEKVGVQFLGIQKSTVGESFPLFGDPLTRSSFAIHAGETLGEALARVRWEFHVGEFKP